MPSRETDRERIAALETWRQEHKAHHDREDRLREGSRNRGNALVVAVFALIGTVVVAGITAIITILLKD